MKVNIKTLLLSLMAVSLLMINISCQYHTQGKNESILTITVAPDSTRHSLSRLVVNPLHPRHFADTLGQPVFLIGDSPQNLPQKLTIDEMHAYFSDCRSKGINLCWVCIDGQPTASPIKEAPVDRKENPEFLPGGTPANWDLSRVNPAYFAETIDSVLSMAEYYGIYINLMPMSQCYWSPENIKANSPEKCFNYGVFLGKRYKNYRNILWLFGNDNLDSSRQCPIARGILSTGDKHLMSIHVYNRSVWGPDPKDPARGESGNFFKHVPRSTMTWVTYNNLYSDMTVFNQARFIYYEYKKKDIMPIIMSEGPYQKLSAYNWQVATNMVSRSLNFRVALGGGFGGAYTYGCDWLQRDTQPWNKYLDSGARKDIKYFSDLIRNRKWWNLAPDWDRKFLTKTSLDSGSYIENDNYTIAAWDTAYGKLGIVYCTTSQTVSLDLSKMSGKITVRWYDPTSGKYQDAKGSPFQNQGFRDFTTPDRPHHEFNTDGSEETSNDWVLVADVNP